MTAPSDSRIFPIWLALVLMLFIGACAGGGGSGDTQEEDFVSTDDNATSADAFQVARELTWLYEKMKSEYLWYDETPDLDFLTFDSAEELLEAMVDREQDRFSYLTTLEQNTASQTATAVTYGFRILTAVQPFQVTRVYQGGSAADAGIQRGDLLTRVGSIEIIDEESATTALILLSERSEGSTLEFEFQRENVEQSLVHQLAATEVSRQTVDAVLTRTDANGESMGYLNVFEFRTKTNDELRSAFLKFRDDNVTSLVIDLRDNSGGSIRTVALLGSLILGQSVAGLPFIDFRFSDLGETIFSSEGFITGYQLSAEDNAVPMRAVHIITSNRTCSASEILINSLRPYIPVSLSGSTTCGKPYGFYGRLFEEKSVLWAINFQSDNVDGEGGWVDGLSPTCEVHDFQVFPYGDSRDRHLRSATEYLETGTCTVDALLADSLQSNARHSMHSALNLYRDNEQVGQRFKAYNPRWTVDFKPDIQP